MGTIRDVSDFISKSTSGDNGDPELIFFHKMGRDVTATFSPTTLVGANVSYWRGIGSPESAPVPTTGQILYSSSIGAIKFASATPGFERNITNIHINHQTAANVLLYDRLYQIGGLNATLTTEQTVQGSNPTPAITRNVSGEANFMMVEVYTTVGTTAAQLSVEYINQNGAISSSVLRYFGGASFYNGANFCHLIPFSGTDSGVRAVTKVRLSNSTGTAGNFGITIGKPIAYISCTTGGVGAWRDFVTGLPTIPKLDNNSCIALLSNAYTATTSHIWGFINTVQA
jgi:hypothetical protein